MILIGDEAKNAPKRVPWSMFLSVAINAVFAFAFIICLLYCLGDFDTVVGSATGLPIIEVYYQATKSKAATNFFVAILFVMYAIGNFNILASVSRLTWAFARDRGLPFSSVFSYVRCYARYADQELIVSRSTQVLKSHSTRSF